MSPVVSAAKRAGLRPYAKWLLGASLFCILASAVVWFSTGDELLNPVPSKLFQDRHGNFLGEFPTPEEELGFWPMPDELPHKLVVATLYAEDRHFYKHSGIYWPSVARAFWQNLRNRRVISGASTLPMQVARMQKPRARTWFAKLRESLAAMRLVRRHGHELLLRQYFRVAPYGNQCRGAARASFLYFNKPLEDLSWLQAAYLAALPQRPGRMSPWTESGRILAFERANRILKGLHGAGLISEEDLHVALHSELALAPRPQRNNETLHALLTLSSRADLTTPFAGIFRSTLDLNIQMDAQQLLSKQLRQLRWRDAGNGAVVVIDSTNGEVLAYVGSDNYFDTEHHGAIDYAAIQRSPGSTLKPFIVAAALETRLYTAASELSDIPAVFAQSDGSVFLPENMGYRYMGPMLLRNALANSRNLPLIQLLQGVGVEHMVSLFEQAGVKNLKFHPNSYGLSLVTGSLAISPLELAKLYTALANRGQMQHLTFFKEAAHRPPMRLFGEEAAMLTAHMLADADARRPVFFAGGPWDIGEGVAIKTGTSQGFRDAWTVAFDGKYIVVVWIGNHDLRRMNRLSGGEASAPIANKLMHKLSRQEPGLKNNADKSNANLPPLQAVRKEICAFSGFRPTQRCPHTKTEFFIVGTEPVDECPFHRQVAVDLRNGFLAGPDCPKQFVETMPMLALPEAYAEWARENQLLIAPLDESPLCPQGKIHRRIAIREPKPGSRYVFDPNTPGEFASLKFSATVFPPDENLIWLVNDLPVYKTAYPHEWRWPMSMGRHRIRAVFETENTSSAEIEIEVAD
ncbi:MAG: transglycosylase domain-containing protein [Cystobacterineae bacterium]|nr:transglycosylase domain-containing protein [Cystobacterineae bacterium]